MRIIFTLLMMLFSTPTILAAGSQALNHGQLYDQNLSAQQFSLTPVAFDVTNRIAGKWQLINEHGENLGNINITTHGSKITGSGQLLDNLIYGRKVKTVMEEVILTEEAIRFEVTYFDDESGEQHSKSMLLTLPKIGGRLMKGTLQTSQNFELVSLEKVGELQDNDDFEDPNEYDMPGFGVTGPAYRLINVPEGQNLKLRSGPAKTFERTGTLAWDAEQVLVLGCTPKIDPHVFDGTNSAGKRRLLQKSWCKVSFGYDASLVEGYIHGKYLDPQYN